MLHWFLVYWFFFFLNSNITVKMYHFGEMHLKLFYPEISYCKWFAQQLATNGSIHLKKTQSNSFIWMPFLIKQPINLDEAFQNRGLVYLSASADYERNTTVIRCWITISPSDDCSNWAAGLELALTAPSPQQCLPRRRQTSPSRAKPGRSLQSLHRVDHNALRKHCTARNNCK